MDALDIAAARVLRDKYKPYERPWVKTPAKKQKKKRSAAEALRVLRPHLAGDPPTPAD